MLYWYDEKRSPIRSPKTFSRQGVFAIAKLSDDPSINTVGLFIEDDDNMFLKCTFDAHWLKSLESVAWRMYREPENEICLDSQ